MKFRALATAFGCVGLALISLPPYSAAADSASATGTTEQLHEIVVTGSHISETATKTQTPLVEIPQAISVISGDMLSLQAVQRVQEALRYTAGVGVEEYGFDTRYDYFFIRGFETEVFGNYQDGLHQPCGSATCYREEPYGLESIEILKGPSSVLYGQNAPGGLINFISKRPLDAPYHEVGLEAGNFDRYVGSLDFSGPLDSSGNLDYRVTALWRDSNTQVQDVIDDRRFIAPALTWHISDDASITFLSQYLYDKTSGNDFYYSPASGGVTNIRTGDPAFDAFDQTQYALGYELNIRLSRIWTFVQNVRWSHIGLIWDFVDDAGLEPDGVTLDRYSGINNEKQHATAVDNQLQATFDTGPIRHHLLVGVDYSRMHYIYYAGFGDAPSIDLLDPQFATGPIAIPSVSDVGVQTQQQVGVYSQDQLKLDRWIVTLSGREDHATSDTGDLVADSFQSQSDNHFSGRAGVGYKVTDKLIPYVSYSTSFQLTPGVDFYQQPFKPSTGKQAEVGVKYEPTAIRGLVTLSLYDLQQQNVLTQDPNPAHLGYSVQTGAIRSAGVELETSLQPTRSLSLTTSYSYDMARVTSSTGPDEQKIEPVIPAHQASLFANYVFLPDHSGGVFGFGGGVRYVGRSYADQVETLTNASTTLFDIDAHYDLRGWRFAINSDNLFNRNSFVCSYGFCSEGARRTIIGSVRLRW